jgi:6-phosphogluconolactonase
MNEVRVFDSAAELTRAAAEQVASFAEAAASERGRFTWALSGGSTPRDLYRALASPPWVERLPWNAIHLFWGDERCVPPDHPESNYRMAKEAMIDRAPLPPENVHRIRAEMSDAAAASSAYETELRSFFGARIHFDLILLGLGKDAHTASLFPQSPVLQERGRLVAAPWVEALRTFRITLTPPALNAARHTLFLVSGGEKAAALRAVLAGERDPLRLPAQIVEGNVLWLVDRTAAALLTSAA